MIFRFIYGVAQWNYVLMVYTSALIQKRHMARSHMERYKHIVGNEVSSVTWKRCRSLVRQWLQKDAWEAVDVGAG